MRNGLLFLALTCSATAGPLWAQARESVVLQKLGDLAGDWEGTATWSGARNSTDKMDARYYKTGNGTAVIEDLIVDGTPLMTSVYHLDGADLRVTHFCGANNQPRLKASSISPDNSQVTFSFVDITNLHPSTAGHVEGIELRFLAPDHITVQFRFMANGKESQEVVDLRRKKTGESPRG